MGQFMQDIVSEVLKRNRTDMPVRQQQASSPSSPSHPLEASDYPIPGVYRPNYQRQKRQDRIGAASPPSKPATQTAPIQSNRGHLTKDFMENQISDLQRLTLAQINGGPAPKGPFGAETDRQGAQLIGKTRNGQYVWHFPSLNPRLGPTGAGDHIGFLTGASYNPGTLFLVDERLQLASEITYESFGERKGNGFADTVRMSARDARVLEQVLKDLYIQLNRGSIRPIETYVSEKPSPFLFDSLSFTVNASIAALAGVSAISGMALLDRYFYKNPQVSLQFNLRDNCLLIAGPYGVIQHAIKQLEDDAVQLLL